MERGCDGVLVMSAALLEEDLAALGPKQERLVMVNNRFDSMPDQCFTVDHVYGGQLAARTLLEHRHRAIAVIAGPADIADNIMRINGFLGELAQAGIDPGKLWIGESDFSAEGGWHAANQLLKSGYHFTALFCANDEMAVGALSCFQEAGIRVPHDLSVIGYDDTPAASYAAPRLTSVHIPWREMTQSAVRKLLNMCYDLKRPVKRKFPISLTTRGSLSKPPAMSASRSVTEQR
jgi:LacI family transcriptional regulator